MNLYKYKWIVFNDVIKETYVTGGQYSPIWDLISAYKIQLIRDLISKQI